MVPGLDRAAQLSSILLLELGCYGTSLRISYELKNMSPLIFTIRCATGDDF